jgi:predicted oxidoreductase
MMKSIRLGPTGLSVSALSLGCMRMGGLSDPSAAVPVLEAALASDITFFDHADIYGGGEGERRFAKALRELGVERESVVLQSKCGIVKGQYFDFSREHILSSVDGILERLDTAYLDVLLLHRPDALMEPEEIADAFNILRENGKVRHFGVSNQNPAQMELLRRALDVPLAANQVQFGLGHTPLIDHGLNVNMSDNPAVDRDGGILDYCRLHHITPQAWSPLQHAFFQGPVIGHPEYAELNRSLDRIAAERGVEPSAVAVAWILRHPANWQVVLGSMTPERIRGMARACDITLTRPEWYELYRAAGHRLP